MSKYIDATDENIKGLIDEGVTLVDFWAPWCGPCRMVAPVIDELANDFDKKANIVKVNTDEMGDLAAEYNVRSIPTVIIFKDGNEQERFVGAATKETYAEAIDKLILKGDENE
jgi:thioredoxin 1